MVEQEIDADIVNDPSTCKSKTAIVIGGSGGIGAAVCEALSNEGFQIAVHYHNNKRKADGIVDKIIATGNKAIACHCDITEVKAVQEMVAQVMRKLDTITVLVNCATSKIAPIKFTDLSWEDFDNHFNNQIKGNFNLLQTIVPIMEKNKYGKIIHLDTQYVDAPESHLLPYISAKSALRGFTKSLAYDLAPKGIRVNSVSPGMTETEQIADVPERIRLITAAKTPLKRLATPKDVANVVCFLASDKSDYLSGETIRVNGGQVMI